MAHDVYDEKGLSHEELKYLEHTRRGADFLKIDLFRSAREEFRAALAFRPGDELCKQRIAECDIQITHDAKLVYAIVPLVMALIAAIAIFA